MKNKTKMITINLMRCVSPDLHTALKIIAAKQGKTLKNVCLDALAAHVNNNNK